MLVALVVLMALVLVFGGAVVLRLSRKPARPLPARPISNQSPVTMSVPEIQHSIIAIGLEVFFPFGGKEQALLPGCLDILEGKAMWRDVRRGLCFMGVNHRLENGVQESEEESGLDNPESLERQQAFEFTIIPLCQRLPHWVFGVHPDVLKSSPATEITSDDVAEMRYWRRRWRELGGKIYQRSRLVGSKGDPMWTQMSELGLPFPPFRIACGLYEHDVSWTDALELKVPVSSPPAQAQFDPVKFKAALRAALERAISKHPAGRGLLD
jgi:hypothetical protein